MSQIAVPPNPSPFRRVVVTGMGAITPVGHDVETSWRAVVEGRSGIGPVTLVPVDHLPVRIAGEVKGFDPTTVMEAKEARRADRFSQFAVAAAREAVRHSGLVIDESNANDIGVIIGSGAGGIQTYTDNQHVMDQRGAGRLNPLMIPMITADSASVQVSIQTGAHGVTFGVAAACSTGNDAIAQAFYTIQRGDAKAMLTGGAEAAVTHLGLTGFSQLRALSRRNDDPTRASRPFDKDRDGFVLSEGSGVLVLEDLESALARGATPLAEILACAATSDAVHLTDPDREAVQASRAISLALAKAGVSPGELSYINAHATATSIGDVSEVRALKRSLGDAAYRVPVSSTKSVTGHLLGAAGAVEAIWCIKAMEQSLLPPTINLDTPDPECDLDFVPHTARSAPVDIALSAAFAFGGHNSMLLMRRWTGA
ncbi:MAG: beta-ketoacyl-ACP synthase II [Verrucomicrobiales bacterium]|nr:beta-ketoacyl-ACP synthase II [Verrucomicrobiales bacterium]